MKTIKAFFKTSIRFAIALCAALLGSTGCSQFPSRYENIDQSKTRPFAIICDPADATPGDTVHVRLMQFTPVDSPAMNWTLSLDYAEDEYGRNILESHVVDLNSMMLPGAMVSDFRFVLPESTFLFSTMLQRTFNQPAFFGGVGIAGIDSLLKLNRSSPDSLPSELRVAIDDIACKVRLRVHVQADVDLEIFKDLLVRYSHAYASANQNVNPVLHWVGVFRVERSHLSDPDSIEDYPHSFQYLYNALDPASVSDTVEIDTGCTYFFAADSGINGTDTSLQHYRYFSTRSSVYKTGMEEYYYDWFYTNLDYQAGMEMDSLIMIPGDRSRYVTGMLPPVDTAMHNFKIYTVVRDRRVNQPMFTTGVAYAEVQGYFRYSDAYAATKTK